MLGLGDAPVVKNRYEPGAVVEAVVEGLDVAGDFDGVEGAGEVVEEQWEEWGGALVDAKAEGDGDVDEFSFAAGDGEGEGEGDSGGGVR